jgi:hypothetical protein
MDASPEPTLCRIEQSLGRSEICPGASCPLWDGTRGASGGSCLFAELDLGGRHDLAGWLHDLRMDLEKPGSDETEARRLFFERLNAGRSD